MQLDDVRSDLRDTHDDAWQGLARPGTWLTGAERVAVAQETRRSRNCSLCRERKQALSPYAAQGEHDVASSTPLSASLVEMVHRITTDPGRLSKDWYEGLHIDPPVYVETLIVAATTVGIDTFHRAVAIAPRPLPTPQPGEPSRRMPRGPLDHTMAWVPTRKLMGAPNVARSISLVPSSARLLMALSVAEYVPSEDLLNVRKDPGRAISRSQMELIASRLAARNECFY